MKTFEIDDLTNIILNLYAGLHPLHLQEAEVALIKEKYGENWLEELGYTKNG